MSPATPPPPSVLIIGAGAAGISAALRLLDPAHAPPTPISVTILEAEPRWGGRVHSVPFDGVRVDLGGQWVHGEIGNIVYETVKDSNLLSPSFNTYEDMTFYTSEGVAMEKAVTDELFAIGGRILDDMDGAKECQEGDFGEYFVKRFNRDVEKNRPELKEISKLILEWFNKFFLCLDPAKSWHDIPTIGPFKFEKCKGDQQLNWRDKGYRTYLEILMKTHPIEQLIHLNKEVTTIKWDGEEGVVARCSDGSSFRADRCLITVSLGVLKLRRDTLFEPPLPDFKMAAIDHMSIGVANKILLRFPKKWWSDDVKGFSLCWTARDKLNLKKSAPTFEPSHNGRSWLEDVFGFYVIDSHQRTLLGWVTGQTAGDVEHLTDTEVVRGCMFLLRKFVGDKFEIMEPEAVLRSKWKSNPHFNGAYSYYGIEQHAKGIPTEDLIRPVRCSKSGRDVLFFAGEATHPTHFSTVHGAVETGRREADRMIGIYNQQIL